MKRIVILIFVFFSFEIQAQVVTVKLQINNAPISADTNVELFLVQEKENYKVVIKPILDQGKFVVPDELNNREYKIVLKYDKQYIGVSRFIQIDRDMYWKFGFNKEPNECEYYVPEGQEKDVQAVSFLIMEPGDGDGVVTLVRIIDLKKYLSECEKSIE